MRDEANALIGVGGWMTLIMWPWPRVVGEGRHTGIRRPDPQGFVDVIITFGFLLFGMRTMETVFV